MYGNTTADANVNNPFQYTGRENDGTGLYYYRARYYSPTLHRFISDDPKGLRAGINMSTYVGGNPLQFKDPLGLDRWGDDPSLKQIPNSTENVLNWLYEANANRPSDPYGYLFDARNTYHLDRNDDNLAAAERYEGAFDDMSLYSDTLLVGQTGLKLARDVCIGGFCGSDIFGKNGSRSSSAEFVDRWGSMGNFDREWGAPYKGKKPCPQ